MLAFLVLTLMGSAEGTTHVIIIGVENMKENDFSASKYKSSNSGFGRIVNKGTVLKGATFGTWQNFFKPQEQTKSFFDHVNNRIIEMKRYHSVISDKFAQDFTSAAVHTFPPLSTVLEEGMSVDCPPYTVRAGSPPCNAIQELKLVHTCVEFDEETKTVTGPGACATSPDAENSGNCETCQLNADQKVIETIQTMLDSNNAPNIIFGYLQSQKMTSINKSLRSLMASIDKVENDVGTWREYSLIVTGATHSNSIVNSTTTPWMIYGAGIANGGTDEIMSPKLKDDVTLGTTLKLLGLSDSHYSSTPSEIFSISSSLSDIESSSVQQTFTSHEKSCLQHSGYMGACPGVLEQWFYKEFPQHVAGFSFLGGMIIAFALVCFIGIAYAATQMAITGSKRLLGYQTVSAGDFEDSNLEILENGRISAQTNSETKLLNIK